MRGVPDWSIQAAWWASGIFATGAVWYFLSAHEYAFAIAAAVAAVVLAFIAIFLHTQKDALTASASNPERAPPTQKDRLVTARWWENSKLRAEYEKRGINRFYWSNADAVAERQAEGYEFVFLDDAAENVRYRIINRSGQILMGKRDA